jgi:glucosamine kinase
VFINYLYKPIQGKEVTLLKEKVFIGVDGGGTYTAAIAITEKGHIIGKSLGEQTNFYTSNMDTAKANMKETIDRLLEQYCISDYECISIGMSSLDYEPDRDFVDSFASGIFPAEKVEMHSDVYMALMGMTLGKPGIMIVSGTGSIAIAMDQVGKVHILGGWGYLLRDEGSGYDIALQGIDAALKSAEGLGEKTILEQKVLEFFKADTHRGLIDIFYNPPLSTSRIAGFGKVVIETAEQGDKVAISIIDQAVKTLVGYACRLVDKVGSEDCIIGMYGSVLHKNPRISNAFIEQVHQVYPNTKIGFPEFKPETGAVIYAMIKRGLPINQEILDNIRVTMTGV